MSVKCAFTEPTFRNFACLCAGWVAANAPGTVSAAIRGSGPRAAKHFSAYYRFFARARWSLDSLGLLLLASLLPFAPEGTLVAVVDDTLARKGGRRIWGANVHHDPLQWIKKAVSFGHNWVVLAIAIRVPWVERPVAVPVLFRLYRSKRVRTGLDAKGRRQRKTTGEATDEDYRTRPELAVEMLALLREAVCPERKIQLLGDTAYGGKSVARFLPEGVELVSRMCMAAALYEPAPPRKPGQRGAARKKGARLPSPKAMAEDGRTPWRKAKVRIYGKTVAVLYKHVDALWYSTAGQRLLRVVVVRDPSGRRKDDCFYATGLTLAPAEIVELYAVRWCLEVAFRDIKQSLGFEAPESRAERAVQRSAPFACVVYALTVVWFCRVGHRTYKRLLVPAAWYRHKAGPSFADMLRGLRYEFLREELIDTLAETGAPDKSLRLVERALRRVA